MARTAVAPAETKQTAAVERAFKVTPAKKVHHVRSRSDIVQQQHASARLRDLKSSPTYPAQLSRSLKARRSFLDDGSRVVPPTECFFPRPQKGQSLTSFLSSSEFSNCAELDKENAHFCVSEALISALEQMKWRHAMSLRSEEGEDSDEEVQQLKQRVRIRRREKLHEKSIFQSPEQLLSDGRTDSSVFSATTSPSPSSSLNSSASYRAPSAIESEDDVEELNLSDNTETNLSSIREGGLSLSMASLYSDADIRKAPPDACSQEDSYKYASSAEAVALSLLKKFSEKQLPKASDLVWLVSESDVPQSLLPLPDSWPISPDEALEDYGIYNYKTRLRGNLEWAPPREQIVLSLHTKPKLKVQLNKQKYRCAGCGMKVSQALASRLRYCEYLGKLFCHCCHSNSTAVIPARVLHRWDFGRYPVSNFARDLLERLWLDPLFDVQYLNPTLYRRSSNMSRVREYRTALHHLQQYVRTCRCAITHQAELERFAPHLLDSPDVYSLEDLQEVRSGTLVESLRRVYHDCAEHCMKCPLCHAHGFICERCHDGRDIIFPFQLSSTFQCPACGACFHRKCYIQDQCPRCQRLEIRKKRLADEENDHSS